MCSKDDFLSWDELDLDDLLVDYTDYDDVLTTDSSSSDASTDYDQPRVIDQPAGLDLVNGDSVSTKPAAARPKINRRPYVYCCPVCEKMLRSPSGFRGYVMNQHPTFNRSCFRGKISAFSFVCHALSIKRRQRETN
jgi:hypothetical protein